MSSARIVVLQDDWFLVPHKLPVHGDHVTADWIISHTERSQIHFVVRRPKKVKVMGGHLVVVIAEDRY